MDNLLAVATYGAQRVRHPVTGQTVNAYKLGYTGAGRALLLAVLKAHAQDVTPRRASYHYVRISGEVTVWHGCILLKVSDDELTKAESLTLQTCRPAVYRWMSGAWHELPTSQSPDYRPLTGRSGPSFNPTGLRIASRGGGDAQAAAILGVDIHTEPQPETPPDQPPPATPAPATIPDEPPAEDNKPQPIRIIKPLDDEHDAMNAAIRQTKAEALPVPQSNPTNSGKRALVRIPQAPCGELTGSITGNVWCYGYAVHEGVCVYVNMGGPRMAVEAIRAKLAKGAIVTCVPWDAPSVELTAGEGSSGMYTAFTQNIPEARFTSLILLHAMATQPNYGGKSTTFILHVSDEQALAQLRHHVTKLVKVPVFPEWTGYLWRAGQSALLVRTTRGAGGLDVLAVDLDMDAWTRLITGGLSQGIIRLPD